MTGSCQPSMSMLPLEPAAAQLGDDVGPVAVAEARACGDRRTAAPSGPCPAARRRRAWRSARRTCGPRPSGSWRPCRGRGRSCGAHSRSCGMGSIRLTIWWQGSHSRPMLSAGTASNIISQAVGLWAMFQSPVCQVPPMSQFSKAMRTPLSAARLASGVQTFLKRRHALVDALAAQAAGEAGHDVAAEQVRVVDALAPALERLLVLRLVLQRVAENRQRRDHRAACRPARRSPRRPAS